MSTAHADSRDTCYALVPCAGSGNRAGTDGPKQYAVIAGRSVVAHTLAALQGVSRLAATLVVLAPGDAQFEGAAPEFRGDRAWVERCGGNSRAASVAAGLDVLARQPAWWEPFDAREQLDVLEVETDVAASVTGAVERLSALARR